MPKAFPCHDVIVWELRYMSDEHPQLTHYPLGDMAIISDSYLGWMSGEIALRWVPRDPLMISQHCFMWWFGAITRTKVDQDRCRHVVRAWCGTGDTPLLRPTRTQSTATYLTGPLYPLSATTSWSHRPRIWHTSQQWCCRCAQSDCNVIHCLDILR